MPGRVEGGKRHIKMFASCYYFTRIAAPDRILFRTLVDVTPSLTGSGAAAARKRR